MSSEGAILLVTDDAEVARVVGESVAAANRLSLRTHCTNLEALANELERTSATAAIVDIEPRPQENLVELEVIIGRFPSTRFLVVGSELHNEYLLQAMQAGARHYLTRQALRSDLPPTLDRITRSNGVLERASAVVTVLSTAGGCGATTLAVNLADELHLVSSKPTLLVDLDCCYGAAATHLGVEGMYGIADVLSEKSHLDAELINSTVVRANESVHLLMNPASQNPIEPAPLDLARLPRLLRVCREVYTHIVVDAPRVSIETAALLAKASLATLVVFQVNVNDLKAAKAMMMALVQRGVEPAAVVPVASRYRKRYGLVSLADAQRTLGDVRPGTISNDYTSAQSSLNYGKPLSQCAPRSALRRDIRSLASSLIEAHRGNHRVREW